MKKKKPESKPKEPKGKEFSPRPMASALKGIRLEPAPEPPPKTPKPAQPAPPPADDADLFLRAVAGTRRLDGKKVETPQQEDAELFLQALGDVRPLKGGTGERPPSRRPGEPEIDPGEKAVFLKALKELHLDVTFSDTVPGNGGTAAPIAFNRLRQLKKGAVTIAMELDLHGLTRDEALESLAPFIANAERRGLRAVLVITGKGNHSPGEPVLQRAVIAWLREAGRSMVAEFCPAPKEYGGNGALVVFLKDPAKGKKEESPSGR